MSGRINDLRSYMAAAEDAGMLNRISRPVSLKHELADVAATLERSDAGPALFEAPKDSPWPIFSGAVSSRRTASLALGCESDEVVDRMGQALEPADGIAPVRVDSAAWHDNCLAGDAVDLASVPVPTHSRGDGGAFITGAVSVTKDPVSGRGNLSYNRMLVLGRNILGFNLNEWRDIGTFMRNRADPQAPFDVALAIGLDPAVMIAAGVRTTADELSIAGALRRQPVEVCRGVSADVDVPAHAEVVIEGRIRPGERADEGPLAEFHGYHGEMWPSPTVEVTAVSWRHSPVFQTIIPGWYEHVFIGNVLPREPLLRRFVRHIDSGADVCIPPYGNGFLAVIQIDRDNPGTPKNLAMAALSAHINIRNVVVVDRDIDVTQPSELHWALTNRVHWTDDVFTVAGAQGHEMDPTAQDRGVSTKVGIDATYKRERREYGERVAYAPVDLSEYLS
ncbi:MAG: UbiD family decarboxylase [Acidimicrobiaceae bacterium]|nr:UbiD family decarboxylase [Acidimicrobiaceae bacterium]